MASKRGLKKPSTTGEGYGVLPKNAKPIGKSGAHAREPDHKKLREEEMGYSIDKFSDISRLSPLESETRLEDTASAAESSISELLSQRVAQCVSPTPEVTARSDAVEEESTENMTVPSRTISISTHASRNAHVDRRLVGAAATIGGTAGMLLVGPVSGAALGAAAAYASTREDKAGRVTRKASSLYLEASDRVTDAYIQAAERAVEGGRRKVAKELQSINPSAVPSTLRAPLQRLCHNLEPTAREKSGTKEEAMRMLERYPDRIPIICEKSPYSGLPQIQKTKFAVPGSMLCGEFKYIVHKHVRQAMEGNIRAEETIYIFVNGIAPKTSAPMSEIYEQLRSEDLFLYVTYAAENTLG